MKRHRWDATDRCRDCGVRRNGYGGGRTGMLHYYDAQGRYLRSGQAPECARPAASSSRGGHE